MTAHYGWCDLMPDRLYDPQAWLDLAERNRGGIPRKFVPNVALLLFREWRNVDPDNEHWLEHCNLDQLMSAHENVTELVAFAENFPDVATLPRIEGDDPISNTEAALVLATHIDQTEAPRAH